MNEDMMQWRGPSKPPADTKELADRYAISHLVKIYTLGIDMKNYELCRSAFADDAFVEGALGAAHIDEYLPKAYGGTAVYKATQHNITNQYITVTGDEALMWSYAIAYHMEEPGNGRENLMVGVQYRDQCRRVLEGWLIAKRKAVFQWIDGPMPRK
jgi:hypothetical protein